MLNLHASIDPGRSAGGFQIGQLLSKLRVELEDARVVKYEAGFNLNRAIRENAGVLVVQGFGEPGECSVYFGPDTVRLGFSGSGVLGCIYVFEGYFGSYQGATIGSPLSSVSSSEPIDFDSGDEMYYRVDAKGEYLPGLAIVAAEVDPEQHAATPILGFCVHDWSAFHSAA